MFTMLHMLDPSPHTKHHTNHSTLHHKVHSTLHTRHHNLLSTTATSPPQGPERPNSPVDPVLTTRPVTPAPPEWTSYDAPINFTWVIPDELCGMGWPKSRDQVGA